MSTDSGPSDNLWLSFALMTVVAWGLYGIFLHSGQVAMADPAQGRYKAFFWVGIAYFLFAIVAPAALLFKGGSDWAMPTSGIVLSLIAGTLGAVGAFTVLLAFGAGGKPTFVMSIVFAGAPLVNATVAIFLHPPAGGWGTVDKRFFLGLLLALLGATMVTRYKPGPGTQAPPATSPGE